MGNKLLFVIDVLSFLFFEGRVSLYSPGCPGTLCLPGCPQTQRSACPCFPNARIKGMPYHVPLWMC